MLQKFMDSSMGKSGKLRQLVKDLSSNYSQDATAMKTLDCM